MRVMWCWRCQQDMPMLDEEEFALVARVLQECLSSGRRSAGQGERHIRRSVDDIFEPVRKEYERITGMADCHHNAVMHHRISIYGPPCAVCGKPLRTPQANWCAACWASVERDGP
ncbi:MAG TPA: hypothetical protein VFS21_11310 [Roseiflexaceae bacterium]|nr:hypothetical protein [Roseiflexaceae bacterium]